MRLEQNSVLGFEHKKPFIFASVQNLFFYNETIHYSFEMEHDDEKCCELDSLQFKATLN